MTKTNIQVDRKTRDKLANIGRKEDTYDDIINGILHERNFYEIQEYTNNDSEDLLQETLRVFNIINYTIPEDVNIKGAVELIENDGYNTYNEAIIEIYCMIEDILSPN